MDEKPRPITPAMKVAELLDAYPALESVLVQIAPAFEKLRNPLLRRTVARVTTLAQAARVGGVSAVDLVRRLRREAGQPDLEAGDGGAPGGQGEADVPAGRREHDARGSIAGGAGSQPLPWLDRSRIARTLDARPMLAAGEHPVSVVLRELAELPPGEIYELIAPFEPAPLIDRAMAKGFDAWTERGKDGEFRTWFARAQRA